MEDAAHHDSVRAAELTAHLKAGDVAVSDRAYTDFGFINGLDARGVRFVTRQKRNTKMRVAERLMDSVQPTSKRTTQILADEVVVPERKSSAGKYGGTLRRVTAMVETLRLHGTASPVKSPAVKPKRLVFQLILDFASAGMGQRTC